MQIKLGVRLVVLLVASTTAVVVQSQTALQFVPVTPCRVVDTRSAIGPLGGPAIPPNGTREFVIPNQLTCGIPNTAAAFSLNVTVIPRGRLGYLTVWPSGQPQPQISTLNSDGRVKANAAVVPAGNDEGISVYATDTTDLVLDIDGYFNSVTNYTLAFFPLTPCRVADTRWPQGPLGGPQLQAKTERDFPLLSSACNIPNNAQAYSLNFTVVPRPKLGYLTVWPTGQSQPMASTLNASTGMVTANAAIVPAGLSGAISTYVTDNTDLIIDIDGYFAPPSSAPHPLSLYTLAPCRVLDTRGGNGAFSGMLPVTVLASPCNVSSAEAYILNATVVPQNGHPLSYLTLWPDAEGQPLVSTLNAVDGAVTSNMAIVPTLNGSIDSYATNPTNLILDIFSYFTPIAPLSVTTTALPSGTVNYNYDTTLGATGGAMPYTWSVISGSLPPGLNLDPSSGVISGMPTVAGTYPLTVQVTDSQVPSAAASAPLSITVTSDLTQLSIVTTSLPSGTQNNPYSAMLAATGGITPYTWAVTAGTLPRGLNLNSGTGVISGTPSGGGISSFTVQVTDSNHSTANASLSITITPAVSLNITTTSLPSGQVGSAYSANITAIGGVYPYNWTITAGNLPPGLSLNPNSGAITGTPTTKGTFNFTAQVTDSETPPVSASAQLSLSINAGVVTITTTSLPTGTAGQSYSATLTATGGLLPYSWSVVAGKIPDGLTLNSSTGALSGTPQNVGTSNLTFQVVDSEVPQVSATKQLSLTINPPGGGGNPGLLSGHYAFYLNGFSSSGAWTLAGSFISDGNGNITSGVVDGNSVSGILYTVNVSGTYSITAAGLNTLSLHGPSWGPVTYAFDLDSSGNGRIIEYDDANGNGSVGSGELRKANAAAFSLSALNGSWVFGVTGADHAGRFVNVGVFNLSNGNMTNGYCDTNEAGNFSTCTFSGSVSAVDPTTGRATVTAQSSNGSAHEVVYVVSTGEMLMASIDPDNGNGAPMQVGDVQQQTGPFSNASLSGVGVFAGQDIHGGDGLDQSDLIMANLDGHGNFNTIANDEDTAGTIVQRPLDQGTYSVQANGATTINCSNGGCPVGFLIKQNKGFFVGTGSSSLFMGLSGQSGGPFSNASLSGNYVGGTLSPLDYTNASNEVDLGPANGAGVWTVSNDSSRSDGLDQSLGTIVNYNIASNGRGTMQAVGDQLPAVVYLTSPNQFFVMLPKTDARVAVLHH